jgi:hypothetical protein
VGITWRKSSYSGDNGGNCLEVGTAASRAEAHRAEPHGVVVRDTTNRAGTTLTFPPPAWRALLTTLVSPASRAPSERVSCLVIPARQ